MAKSYADIHDSVYITGNKMGWTNSLLRSNGIPIDITDIYDSYNSAVQYAAANPVAYEGQVIAVTENGDTSVYVITPKKQGTVSIDNVSTDVYIKQVGTKPVGDDASISVDADGKVSLRGFSNNAGYYKYVEATETVAAHYEFVTNEFKEGLQPKVKAKTGGGFELAWYEPSTLTVEGLNESVTNLTSSLNSVTTRTSKLESEVGIDSDGAATGSGLKHTVSSMGSTLGDLADTVGDSNNGLVKDVATNTENIASINTAIGVNTSGSETGIYKEIKDLKAEDKSIRDSITLTNANVTLLQNTKANSDDVYTKDEANTAISTAVANAAHLKYTIKATKADIDTTAADADQYIYLVPKTAGKTDDGYDEYMVIDVSGTKKLEKVGDWDMDLSGYATTEALNTALSAYTIKTADTGEFTNTNGEISIKAIPQSKITDLGTDLGKKEDKANKIDSLKGATSEANKKLKYPSVYAVEVALDDKLNKSDNLIEKQTYSNVVVGKFKGDVLQLDDSKQAQLTDVRNISFTTTSDTSGDPGITFNVEPANGLWSNIVTVDGENATTLKDSLDAKVTGSADDLLTADQKAAIAYLNYKSAANPNGIYPDSVMASNIQSSQYTGGIYHVGASLDMVNATDFSTITHSGGEPSNTVTLQSVLDSKVNTNSDQLLTDDQKAAISYLNFDKTSQKISPSFIDTSTLTVDDMQVTSGIELLGDGTFSSIRSKNKTDGETTSLETVLNNKVDKVDGYGLSKNDYTDADKTKVNKFAIYSGSNTALKDAVTVPGALGVSFSNIIDPATGTKLSDAIAASNKIESVKVGGTAITIGEDKSVNIPIGSASALGVVKSSADKDKVTINTDGTMTVNSYNAIKLYVDDTDTLNING